MTYEKYSIVERISTNVSRLMKNNYRTEWKKNSKIKIFKNSTSFQLGKFISKKQKTNLLVTYVYKFEIKFDAQNLIVI